MRFPFRPIAAARVVGLVVVVAALGACTAHDGAGLVSGGTPAPTAVPEQFLKSIILSAGPDQGRHRSHDDLRAWP